MSCESFQEIRLTKDVTPDGAEWVVREPIATSTFVCSCGLTISGPPERVRDAATPCMERATGLVLRQSEAVPDGR